LGSRGCSKVGEAKKHGLPYPLEGADPSGRGGLRFKTEQGRGEGGFEKKKGGKKKTGKRGKTNKTTKIPKRLVTNPQYGRQKS